MSLWKRLKNLWWLSGQTTTYVNNGDTGILTLGKLFSTRKMATIVQDSPETLLDNLDLS